jgi:hypothetical protein
MATLRRINPKVGDFLTLKDTPSTYSGSGGYLITISDDETGLEFTSLSGLMGISIPYDVAIYRELLGSKNNTNKIFNTPDNYIPGEITVLYNGQVLLSDNDFLETGVNEITMIYIAPHYDDNIGATYKIDA